MVLPLRLSARLGLCDAEFGRLASGLDRVVLEIDAFVARARKS